MRQWEAEAKCGHGADEAAIPPRPHLPATSQKPRPAQNGSLSSAPGNRWPGLSTCCRRLGLARAGKVKMRSCKPLARPQAGAVLPAPAPHPPKAPAPLVKCHSKVPTGLLRPGLPGPALPLPVVAGKVTRDPQEKLVYTMLAFLLQPPFPQPTCQAGVRGLRRGRAGNRA